MRSVLLTLLLTFSSALVWGQQKDLWRTAEKYFDSFQYIYAVNIYERILQVDKDNRAAAERLVVCYKKLNDPQKAEALLAGLCADAQVKPAFQKLYAETLAENAKYQEAVEWYTKYALQHPDDHVRQVIASYTHLENFYRDSAFYKIDKVGFNSDQSDFSPTFFRGSLVFCSARNTGSRSTYRWNNSSFIDLYWAKDLSSTPDPLGAPVNSSLHEGPAAFTPKYDTIFFTRNNYINNKKSKSNDGVMKLKLFYSVMNDGQWGPARNLPMNSDEYSIGHPAISIDRKLYFVSDMPGGYGGTDIYFTKLVNGKWITPQNAGPTINTPGNEMFPFIEVVSGDLYFASSGHPGLGGLDIFRAMQTDSGFQSPVNMGYPINSSRDDFGLIIFNDKGYFSSNRGKDPQDDNIYSFSLKKRSMITIQVVDQNGKTIDNFSLKIMEKNAAVAEDIPNVANSYSHKFHFDNDYIVTCSKEGYLSKEEILNRDIFGKLGSENTIKIVLKESVKQITADLVSNKRERLTGGTLELKNMSTGKTANYTTGDNPVALVLTPGIDYEITGRHTGFKSKTKSVSTVSLGMLSENGTILIELDPDTTLFQKNEIGQIIELHIRYDLGKSTIRPDAAVELDKLVDFLKQHPAVKVELGSHTDARGSDNDNLKLSQRRAESAVQYVSRKGIDSQRLIPTGYGKSDLKIKNAATEEEHQQNRRTTVKIVGM